MSLIIPGSRTFSVADILTGRNVLVEMSWWKCLDTRSDQIAYYALGLEGLIDFDLFH